jgi:catalase
LAIGKKTDLFIRFSTVGGEKGEYFWVQYHLKTYQGTRNLTRQEAKRISGEP